MERTLLARILDEEIERGGIERSRGRVLTRKEQEKYSLAKAITEIASPRGCLTGFEAEVAQQYRATQFHNYNNFIPFDAGLTGSRFTRDLTVGDFSSGGALVATELSSTIVPLLWNKAVAIRLGATVLDGLKSNFTLPRLTSAPQPQSLSEIGAVTPSQPTFDQLEGRPRRISVKITFSRQLALQMNWQIEAYLRKIIFDAVGLFVDNRILNGQGANSEPLGIMNCPGIGVVTFGGTASWSSVLQFEESLAQNNADVSGGKMAYVTTPTTRSRWKQIAKTGVNTSGSVVPVFIWERGNWGDATNDGIVNDYRAAASNNLPNNQVIFGNWPEALVCFWGDGMDLISDPYTSAASAEINLTAILYMDLIIRHPQSFAISADSGSQ